MIVSGAINFYVKDAAMQENKIYPSKDNAINGAVACGVCLVLIGLMAIKVWRDSEDPRVMLWLLAFFGAAALWGLITSTKSYINPVPSFAADAEGFSVRGGAKRPWSEFVGVHIKSNRILFIPIASWVVVRVGSGMRGRKLEIRYSHLSGSAMETAHQIQALAARFR